MTALLLLQRMKSDFEKQMQNKKGWEASYLHIYRYIEIYRYIDILTCNNAKIRELCILTKYKDGWKVDG